MGDGYVVLLHGLGRTQLSFALPSRRLRSAGYEPVAITYPSLLKPIDELAAYVADKLAAKIEDRNRPVHFLTHSLGGIVLRQLLQDPPAWLKTGHAVMLAPPNQGSQLAERFADNLLSLRLAPPAAKELRSGAEGVPGQLPPTEHTVGVIAGSSAKSLWSHFLTGDSDGTVTIDETHLEGMNDFLVVPRGHSLIMYDSTIIDQAIHFFQTGRFEHSPKS